MSKRRKSNGGGSVTGGTGDVKPQFLTASTPVAAAVDDYIIQAINLPVVRPAATGGNATIMEFLSVDYMLPLQDFAEGTAIHAAFLTVNIGRTNGDTCTSGTLMADFADPRTFASVSQYKNTITSGGFTVDGPLHVDLTDQNGNGMLVASDVIYLVQGSVADSTVGYTVVKIKYRYVTVSLIEYIGIVQQQQS